MRRRASGRSVRVPFAAGVALLIAAIALACGDETPAPAPAEPPAAATPEAATPAPAEQMAVPADEPPAREATEPVPRAGASNAVASEGVMPESYPKDVPVYPGSDPGSALAIPGEGVFATFESDESVDAILAYYRDELSKQGWSVAEGPGGGLDATKEGRSVQVRARAGENDRAQIAINIEEGT